MVCALENLRSRFFLEKLLSSDIKRSFLCIFLDLYSCLFCVCLDSRFWVGMDCVFIFSTAFASGTFFLEMEGMCLKLVSDSSVIFLISLLMIFLIFFSIFCFWVFSESSRALCSVISLSKYYVTLYSPFFKIENLFSV